MPLDLNKTFNGVIDTSHHNGRIDLKGAQEAASGVIQKATQGLSYAIRRSKRTARRRTTRVCSALAPTVWGRPITSHSSLARTPASNRKPTAAKLDQFLIARILAARGDKAQLAVILGVLAAAGSLSPAEQATLDLLACAATDAPAERWDALLVAGIDQLTVENRLELGQLALRQDALSQERRHELAALQSKHPLWSRLPVSFL